MGCKKKAGEGTWVKAPKRPRNAPLRMAAVVHGWICGESLYAVGVARFSLESRSAPYRREEATPSDT